MKEFVIKSEDSTFEIMMGQESFTTSDKDKYNILKVTYDPDKEVYRMNLSNLSSYARTAFDNDELVLGVSMVDVCLPYHYSRTRRRFRPYKYSESGRKIHWTVDAFNRFDIYELDNIELYVSDLSLPSSLEDISSWVRNHVLNEDGKEYFWPEETFKTEIQMEYRFVIMHRRSGRVIKAYDTIYSTPIYCELELYY